MIDHAAIQPGTWHHDPAVRRPTGICAPVKSGGELRHSPDPLEGCSAPGATPAHTAIAAGKAVVLSVSSRRHWLQVSARGRPYLLQPSGRDRQYHLPVSASGRPGLPQVSVNDRQCRLRAAVNGRDRLLHVSAAAPRVSPVLRARPGSLPGHHQLPMAVTGELMRPRRRAIAARPAVKARKGYALLLPRRAMAALLQKETPPRGTGNLGSSNRFVSIIFDSTEQIDRRKEGNHG